MSTFKQALQQLILGTIGQDQVNTQLIPPEQGVVVAINGDGTVDVQTASATYQRVGTPIQRVLNAQVVVLTADGGMKVAI
jgi:hypothetical protein